MSRIILLTIFFCTQYSLSAQNIGIGTTAPDAGLHLVNDNGIIAKGLLNAGNTINQTGPGSFLIFNPRLGAFRAGYLDASGANYWDNSSTGYYSIAMGYNAKANGAGGLALGQYCLAGSTNATAIGYGAEATAPNSFAIAGVSAKAKEQFSFALGNYASANTYGSVAIGRQVNAGYVPGYGQNAYAIGIGDNPDFTTGSHFATGSRAFAFGNNCRSTGDRAFAIGNDCEAGADFYSGTLGRYSFALGNSCVASGIFSFAFGNNANTNGHTGSMVLGSRVDGNTVLSPADFYLLAQFAGGYQFQTNNTGTLGVYLNPNSSSWASLCDSTKKEQVLPMEDETVLEKLSNINYSSWKYKDDPDASNRHYGIMAQDFYASFGQDALGKIGSDTLVNPIDLLGVAYSAIKALEKRTDEIKDLKNENALLKERLDKLEALLKKR